MLKKYSYKWLLPALLVYPLIQNIVFFIRFKRLPLHIILNSIIFLPMGLICGAYFIYMSNKSTSIKQRKKMIIGLILSIPFSVIFSIYSGLIVPPVIAVAVFGTSPLILGIFLGSYLGRPKK